MIRTVLFGFVFILPMSSWAGVCKSIWGPGKPAEKLCSLEWLDSKGNEQGLEYRILPRACTLDASPGARMQDCGLIRECDSLKKREGRVGVGRIRFPTSLREICPEGLGDYTLYDFDALAVLVCSGPSAGKIRLQAPSGASVECHSGLK
jgi:hypothetical protein